MAKIYLSEEQFLSVVKKHIFDLYELCQSQSYKKYIDISDSRIIETFWKELDSVAGLPPDTHGKVYCRHKVHIMNMNVYISDLHYIYLDDKPCINVSYFNDKDPIKFENELKRLNIQ